MVYVLVYTHCFRYLAGDGDDMDAVEPDEEEDNDDHDDPEEANDEESSFDKNHFFKQVLKLQQKAVARFSALPINDQIGENNQIDEQIRKSIEGINLHSHVLPCSDYKPETASTEGIKFGKANIIGKNPRKGDGFLLQFLRKRIYRSRPPFS